MASTVITVSPRVPVGDLERQARTRLARDGVAAFAAKGADSRQLAQLRRLYGRLVADGRLHVFASASGPDGVAYLIVTRSRRRYVGWWGSPKTE